MRILQKMSLLGVFFFAMAGSLANAESKMLTPDEVIVGVTDSLMALARTGKQELQDSPDAYFKKVRNVLEPAIDFESIAKNVMGKKYWLSVSESKQVEFVNVFTDSLVRTYGKGMANFLDFKITIDSSQVSKNSPTTHYVVQKVITDKGASEVIYTMYSDGSSWRLRNVVLDGVNLGRTFKSQFAQAVKDAGNDVGLAISTWGKDSR